MGIGQCYIIKWRSHNCLEFFLLQNLKSIPDVSHLLESKKADYTDLSDKKILTLTFLNRI